MKRSIVRTAFIFVTGALTIATGALAQYASDSAAKAPAEFARLVVAPRALGFGVAREVETKFIKIKNTGNIDANVTVVPPSPPFSITTSGSFSLVPGQLQEVAVQFAPTAAGPVRGEMTIQCSNCNSAADDNIAIRLAGNARGPVATASVIATATPTATSSAIPGTATPTATSTPGSSTANALPFQVTAGPFDDADEPFASITICASGTSNCTTVNDVLIDTGSFGLRIFGSQIQGLGITPNTNGDSEIGECAFFGSGTTWGAISTVDVKIAGEPTITIPIQVMDDTDSFAPAPRVCTQMQLMSSPDEAGLNGLLGVGQGTTDAIFTDYFNCSGDNCSELNNPPSADLVPNPVAALPVDNNGVVVSLPSIPAGGQASTDGTLYFGIGTESDNQPAAVKTYTGNNNVNSEDYLNIITIFKGVSADGFFDTGSNGYYFNDNSIEECSENSGLEGFYCPSGTLSESATNKGASGSVSGVVTFSIADAEPLLNSNDAAFDDLGGTYDGGNSYDGFDWGLPFFFGRQVYVGLAGTKSSLGTGPYTAY